MAGSEQETLSAPPLRSFAGSVFVNGGQWAYKLVHWYGALVLILAFAGVVVSASLAALPAWVAVLIVALVVVAVVIKGAHVTTVKAICAARKQIETRQRQVERLSAIDDDLRSRIDEAARIRREIGKRELRRHMELAIQSPRVLAGQHASSAQAEEWARGLAEVIRAAVGEAEATAFLSSPGSGGYLLGNPVVPQEWPSTMAENHVSQYLCARSEAALNLFSRLGQLELREDFDPTKFEYLWPPGGSP